jgi:thermostable 8-oxoguanine DNA glycosylase
MKNIGNIEMKEMSEQKEINKKTNFNQGLEKLSIKYDNQPIYTDVYSLEKAKITLDDLLVECITGLGYKESTFFVDFQNGIGIISTILAIVVACLSSLY